MNRMMLCETDNRSIIQKLNDLINHPSTLDTVRQVAKEKLAKLSHVKIDSIPVHIIPSRKMPSVNLSNEELNQPFSSYYSNLTCGEIYKRLSNMSPMPSDIVFFKQGQIHLMIPPPYMGLTKAQFSDMLLEAIPIARNITCKFVEDKGYHFVISIL